MKEVMKDHEPSISFLPLMTRRKDDRKEQSFLS
jgi:hypothetical protein